MLVGVSRNQWRGFCCLRQPGGMAANGVRDQTYGLALILSVATWAHSFFSSWKGKKNPYFLRGSFIFICIFRLFCSPTSHVASFHTFASHYRSFGYSLRKKMYWNTKYRLPFCTLAYMQGIVEHQGFSELEKQNQFQLGIEGTVTTLHCTCRLSGEEPYHWAFLECLPLAAASTPASRRGTLFLGHWLVLPGGWVLALLTN